MKTFRPVLLVLGKSVSKWPKVLELWSLKKKKFSKFTSSAQKLLKN